MSLLGHILLNNIVPIFLAIGAGFSLARFKGIEPKGLSRAALYIFTPCLVYSLLTKIEVGTNEVVRIVVVGIAAALVSGALAWTAGRLLNLGRVMTTALMLVVMFTNSGNYGLALNQLAFGDEALARAVIFYVTNAALVYTVGIYLASSGRLTALQALRALFSMPPIYAVILALLTVGLHVDVPDFIATPVALLGNASIPLLLVLLGVQIAGKSQLSQLSLVGLASSMRLVLGALVALALASLVNLSGPARQATVVEASMPTAIIVTAVATEFDIEPGFVTSSVVLSTLLSPITLTLLIAFLS